MNNPFFENKGPKKIEEILTQIKSQSISKYSGINITNYFLSTIVADH